LSDVVGEDDVEGLVVVGELEVLGEVVDGDVVVVVGVPVVPVVGGCVVGVVVVGVVVVVLGCVVVVGAVVVVGVIVGVGWDRSTVVGLYVCWAGFNTTCVQDPPATCRQIWAFCILTFIGTMAVMSTFIGTFTSPIRLPCAYAFCVDGVGIPVPPAEHNATRASVVPAIDRAILLLYEISLPTMKEEWHYNI
jgi:hypothetical protein